MLINRFSTFSLGQILIWLKFFNGIFENEKKLKGDCTKLVDRCLNLKDEKAKISITSLYADFKIWFKENVPNQGLSIKNEVKEHFEKKWGAYEKGVKWKGFRLKRVQEEIDDGDVMELTPDDMNNNLPNL